MTHTIKKLLTPVAFLFLAGVSAAASLGWLRQSVADTSHDSRAGLLEWLAQNEIENDQFDDLANRLGAGLMDRNNWELALERLDDDEKRQFKRNVDRLSLVAIDDLTDEFIELQDDPDAVFPTDVPLNIQIDFGNGRNDDENVVPVPFPDRTDEQLHFGSIAERAYAWSKLSLQSETETVASVRISRRLGEIVDQAAQSAPPERQQAMATFVKEFKRWNTAQVARRNRQRFRGRRGDRRPREGQPPLGAPG